MESGKIIVDPLYGNSVSGSIINITGTNTILTDDVTYENNYNNDYWYTRPITSQPPHLKIGSTCKVILENITIKEGDQYVDVKDLINDNINLKSKRTGEKTATSNG